MKLDNKLDIRFFKLPAFGKMHIDDIARVWYLKTLYKLDAFTSTFIGNRYYLMQLNIYAIEIHRLKAVKYTQCM